MVPVQILCRKHLLGEHVEHHMFLGTMQLKKNLNGYVANNLIQPKDLWNRHQALVDEMTRRWMNHKSPLAFSEADIAYLPQNIQDAKVDVPPSQLDLITRCPECAHRLRLYANWKL